MVLQLRSAALGSDRASVVVCGVARRDRHRRRRLRPSRRVRRRRRHSHRRRGADVGARGTALGRRTRGSPAGDDRSHRLAAQRRFREHVLVSPTCGLAGARGVGRAALSHRGSPTSWPAPTGPDFSPTEPYSSPTEPDLSPRARRLRDGPGLGATWRNEASKFADLGPIGILVEDQPGQP